MNAAFPPLPLVDYQDIRGDIQNGDLLLASGSYEISKMIQMATGSPWSHVAFVLRFDVIQRVMVLESIEGVGVRTMPLSQYVTDFEGTGVGYNGRIVIARHKEFASRVTPEALAKATVAAVDRFGYHYDTQELARITARIMAAALGFPSQPHVENQQDICSEFVDRIAKMLGFETPFDRRGFIAPSDFAKAPKIDLLWELKTIQRPAALPALQEFPS